MHKSQARVRAYWRGWVRPIFSTVIVLCAFRSSVADWNDVPTGSMRPTIVEGDRVFVNKLSYDLRVPFTTWPLVEWGEPQRGDIVICFAPDTGERLVKRIVGLPGDEVELRCNVLIINGRVSSYDDAASRLEVIGPAAEAEARVTATESFDDVEHLVTLTPAVPAARWYGPVLLGPGEYFVMGDNRDRSRDSRHFGPVLRDRIVGRVVAVALSFDRGRWFCPRWGRFFHKLK